MLRWIVGIERSYLGEYGERGCPARNVAAFRHASSRPERLSLPRPVAGVYATGTVAFRNALTLMEAVPRRN